MLTIVWDIDDVLNDFMKRWFEQWWCRQNTNCKLNYNRLTENPPHNILGIALEDYQNSIDAFRHSKLFADMPPNPDVLEWFKTSGSSFRHIALSAVPRNAAPISAFWLFTHFGNWIRTFAFIPSQRKGESLPVYEPTKADYIKQFCKADIIIEDNENNIAELKQHIRCFIVSQPWNSSKTSIKDILSQLSNIHSGKAK